MDLGSIFLIIALFIAVILFVARPFLEPLQVANRSLNDTQDHTLSGLLAERDQILNALQELDFDYGLGKIPAEDYPLQRSALVQRGAHILRTLDQMQGLADETISSGDTVGVMTGAPASASELRGDDVEAHLEAAVTARSIDSAVDQSSSYQPGNGRGVVPDASPDDPLEVRLANRRRARQTKAGGFCPQCGGTLHESDRFCPKCGVKLN